MSAPTTHLTTTPSAADTDGDRAPRLTLKPESATVSGYVDGGWWPRSRDLGAELPALLSRLADRLGPVERVSYHLGDWDVADKSIRSGRGLVRLSGFRSQAGGTIDVLGHRQRITLLVVPSDASAQTGDRTLATAGRRDNADTVASLLGATAS